MPTLDWIGKKAVINHHNEVPFHLLTEVPDLSLGEWGSGNLLVEGDTLLALKALLPYYAGQVKCIYIDPPYNSGVWDLGSGLTFDISKKQVSSIKKLARQFISNFPSTILPYLQFFNFQRQVLVIN